MRCKWVTAMSVGWLAMWFGGCSSQSNDVLGVNGSIVGVIAEVQEDVSPPRVVIDNPVFLDDGATTSYERVIVAVGKKTSIFVREPDGSLKPGTLADLAPADSIQAWHTGLELRSLPPAYFATRVEVKKP